MDLSIKPSRFVAIMAVLSILVVQVFPQTFSAIYLGWFVFLSYVVAIAFHEIGYVVAGWLAGFSLKRLIIFTIHIIKTEHGFKIKEFHNLMGFSGLTIMVPLKEGVSRIQLIIQSLGGPLFSLIVTLISI